MTVATSLKADPDWFALFFTLYYGLGLDMDSEKLNSWIQVIGMIGIIASLIFVGLEMQQSREIAISEAYQTRTGIEVGLHVAAATMPEFRSAQAKLYSGESIPDLTQEEIIALEYWVGASLSMWENDHYQYQNGYLSEEHWEKSRIHLKCDLRKYHGQMIEGWVFRKSFQELIDQLLEEIKVDVSECWVPQ